VESRVLYLALVLLVAGQRLLELGLSHRNTSWLRARGGVEAGAGHYPAMVVLHTLFLFACPLEVWLLRRPFDGPLAVAMAAVLVAATALRVWVIRTLGRRWTVRVVCVPGLPRVRRGPYRRMRHPNYLAVVLEMAALPLLHSAWLTALGFSIANLILLRVRIATEERALERHCAQRPASPEGRPAMEAP